MLVPLAFVALSCRGGKAAAAEGGKPAKPREIKITDTKVGTGEPIDEAYIAMVEYVGLFTDSQLAFDRNDEKDKDGNGTKTPYALIVGGGQVVKGLDQGLVGMRIGGEREVFVPWELGYGEEGSPEKNIPGKQDLVYKLKLLDYVKLGEEDMYDSTDVKVGSGRAVKEGDKVTIDYHGAYVNGMRFDDSKERGEPVTFRVGAGRAIKGIDAGVVGMKVGGKRKLRLPPKLVYGESGYNGIQGNQIVIFDITLLSIQ